MPATDGSYIKGDVLVQVTPELLAVYSAAILRLQEMLNRALPFIPPTEENFKRDILAALQIRPNG